MAKKIKTDNSKFKISGIYGLICPLTGSLKYIGQSKNIWNRYIQHKASKGNLPVNLWCKELKSKNLMPDLIIIHECENPISKEEDFISRAKLHNIDLLNLHGGGVNTWYENGKSSKIWVDDKNFSPYKHWLNIYIPYSFKNTNVSKVIAEAKELYSKCKTDKEKFAFQVNCANVLLKCFYTDLTYEKIKYWAFNIKNKVDYKYNNFFEIEFV